MKQKMTRIISLVLVALVASLAVAMLASCGNKINSEQAWDKAFEKTYNEIIKNDANYKMTVSSSSYETTYYVDCNKCKIVYDGYNDQAYYYELKSGKFYRYTPSANGYQRDTMSSKSATIGGIVAEETLGYIDMENLDCFKGCYNYFTCEKDIFTLDQASVNLFAVKVFGTSIANAITAAQVTITFANGLVSQCVISLTAGTSKIMYTFEINYGGQSVTLPKVA